MAGNAKAIAQASIAGLPNLGDLLKQAVAADAEAKIRRETAKAAEAKVQADQSKKITVNASLLVRLAGLDTTLVDDLLNPPSETKPPMAAK